MKRPLRIIINYINLSFVSRYYFSTMNGDDSFRIAILITFRMTCLDVRWIFNIESHEEKLLGKIINKKAYNKIKIQLIPRKRKIVKGNI